MQVRFTFVLAYYKRLLSAAWAEAKRATAHRVITFLGFAVIASFYTWAVGDVAPTLSILVGLATAATFGLVVFLWYCFTIPARIEAAFQGAQQQVYVVQQKRAVEAAMRLIATECRNSAQQRRQDVQQGRDADADSIHAQALDLAGRARHTLEPFAQPFGYTQHIAEIAHAVDGAKPNDAEEAIAQLVELQRVIETQLYSGRLS